MGYYVYIRNDESNHYFKDNTPCKFKVQFKLPLTFDGYWKVALSEIKFTTNQKNSEDTLFIYSSICKESVINGGEHPILRQVNKNMKQSWQHIFDTPFYLPLKNSEIYDIDFDIKTTSGQLASFITSPLYLTLHFKKFHSDYEYI